MLNLGLLVLSTVVNTSGEKTINGTEQIQPPNELENYQLFGNLVTIVSKNITDSENKTLEAFNQYLRTHLIRIKSPLQENKYLDFELNDLITDDEVEGRDRKKKGAIRDLLIPFLLALKYKSSVVLPMLMMTIAFVAFKAFWAGMSGLVISKVIGLKLLHQYLNKPEKEEEEHEEEEQNDDEHDGHEQPVVVYLKPHVHRRKFAKRYDRPPTFKRYYNPSGWDY